MGVATTSSTRRHTEQMRRLLNFKCHPECKPGEDGRFHGPWSATATHFRGSRPLPHCALAAEHLMLTERGGLWPGWAHGGHCGGSEDDGPTVRTYMIHANGLARLNSSTLDHTFTFSLLALEATETRDPPIRTDGAVGIHSSGERQVNHKN